MKKLFIFLGVLIFLAGGSMFYYTSSMKKAKFPLKTDLVNFQVKKGETLYTVLSNLEAEGKVGSTTFLKLYIKKNKITTSIKPGTYNISKDKSLEEILAALNKGEKDKDVVEVTIPEGYDIDHIGAKLEEKGIITKKEFIESCKAYTLPAYVKVDEKRRYALEGYLFPDTYELKKGMQGKDIIDIMISKFENVLKEVEKSTGKTLAQKDIDKLIIMASIVEKEIESKTERAKAASVFYNRLSKGMKLQSCATVLYAQGVYKPKLTNEDTRFKSPFNTYIVDGLPVGPICSPGKDCIIAALIPETTNYLYFVSNNDGTHFFTDNYNKFLEVKARTQGD